MQTYTQVQKNAPKHRCKADIMAIILEAEASGGTTKSKIYYRCFDLSKIERISITFRREWIN